MKMKIYIPVSVSEELPVNNTEAVAITVNCITDKNHIVSAVIYNDGFISNDKM